MITNHRHRHHVTVLPSLLLPTISHLTIFTSFPHFALYSSTRKFMMGFMRNKCVCVCVREYVMLSILTHTPFKFIIQIFIVHLVVSARSFVRSGRQYTKCKSIRIHILRNTHTHTHTHAHTYDVINIVRWIFMEYLSV